MKLQKIQLKNFKRFGDLTIDNIPQNTKLVLLIGSNGCGKSSVFDAFEWISKRIKRGESAEKSTHYEDKYYVKLTQQEEKLLGNLPVGVSLEFYNSEPYKRVLDFVGETKNLERFSGNIKDDLFYGRSSLRQVPRLTNPTLKSINILKDEDRPQFFIDTDNRFENDVSIWLESVLQEVFGEDFNSKSLQERFISPINTAFSNIFGEKQETSLSLQNVLPPRNGAPAQINFKKGNSEFGYELLSAGEKEVFGILLNLLVRRDKFQDTIYFFDELDLHLHTSLQVSLLKEITENWIPENCQLWTASHSLGFIEYAKESENAVIIDFDDLDFDTPQILIPTDKTKYEIFEIAVSKEFIDKVFQGRKIIFAENWDAPLYNNLSIDDTFFFTAIDKADVFHKSKNLKTQGLVDRDFLTDNEISQIQSVYQNIKILPYYSIENLLFHPDNLAEYFSTNQKEFDIVDYKNKITAEKNNERDYIVSGIFNARSGYPFFKENEHAQKLKDFRNNSREIIELLRSDDFETFYKVFPAKDYGKSIESRTNLNKKDLAKTDWFKIQIENLLKNRD